MHFAVWRAEAEPRTPWEGIDPGQGKALRWPRPIEVEMKATLAGHESILGGWGQVATGGLLRCQS
jgi:hypothetical protein